LQQQTEVRIIQQAVGNLKDYEPKYVAALIGRSEEIFFTGMRKNRKDKVYFICSLAKQKKRQK
jgi:hypothetical protein